MNFEIAQAIEKVARDEGHKAFMIITGLTCGPRYSFTEYGIQFENADYSVGYIARS